MTFLLIIVGLVAIWFASAWVVVRIGAANRRDINADVLDGALMLGPFTFLVIIYGRYEDAILRWFCKRRRWVIRYWPTRTIVIELSRLELAVTHFAKPRTP